MAEGTRGDMERNVHSRPLLCSDVTNISQSVPERLQILSENNSSNPYDALVISTHVLMLEVGFHPVGLSISDESCQMPENWKLHETYKLSYHHVSCPDVLADMTALKAGLFLAIFAKVKQEHKTESPEVYNLHLLVKDYIKNELNTEKAVYSNLPKLSCEFKNNIGLPLIMECQEVAGITPTVGFSSLPTEIKTYILSYLDARSLLRIGCVNKELNELSDQQRLWKRRLEYDFSALSSLNIDDIDNYKMMYKIEYLDRRKREKARETYVVPQFPYPFRHPLSLVFPDRYYGFSLDNPHEVRGAFPHIRFRSDIPPRYLQGPYRRFL